MNSIVRNFSVYFAIFWIYSNALATEPAKRTHYDYPRLIAAEKDGKLLFFLPELHYGSTLQLDSYFKEIIKIAFERSSRLFLERADEPLLYHSYFRTSCSNNSPSEEAFDASLNSTFINKLPLTAYASIPGNSISLSEADKISRFVRFTTVLFTSLPTSTAHDGRQQSIINLAAPPSTVLMLHKPKKWASIDTVESLFSAYCRLSPIERNKATTDLLNGYQLPDNQSNKKAVIQFSDQIFRDQIGLIEKFIENGQKSLLNNDDGLGGNINRFVIFQRNRTWIEQINLQLQNKEIPFYALGAMHFLDGSYGDGLISMLRKEGYRLTIIKSKRQLKSTLALHESTSSALIGKKLSDMLVFKGKCKKSASIYFCAWGNGQSFITESTARPNFENLTVCLMHETAANDELHCSGPIELPIPSTRQRDLLGAEPLLSN